MKNKKGKKLVVLGAMAALLTLIGVSGSQTYAKYIEEAKVTTQKATVARWGFVQSVTVDYFFGKQYGSVVSDELTKVVASYNTDQSSTLSANARTSSGNIVQPGGSGSLTYTITGYAEVAAEFTFSANATELVELMEGSTRIYEPLKWKFSINSDSLGEPEYKCDWSSWNDFYNYLTDDAVVVEYSAGSLANATVIIEWKWDFSNGNDVYDTILGQLAAGADTLNPGTSLAAYSNSSTTVDVQFGMTATQIQK